MGFEGAADRRINEAAALHLVELEGPIQNGPGGRDEKDRRNKLEEESADTG